MRRARNKTIGLGDLTENLLREIGVTPDKYCEAKRLFGLAARCFCKARKHWMNKVKIYYGL